MEKIDDYKIDKSNKYYGFKSWNDFFIRTFKDIDTQRPIAKTMVVSPCDFHIVNFQTNLKKYGDFVSVKGDNYRLVDLLDGIDPKIIDKFIGGTLLQGFLDAENYHRYHSPVDGKLEAAHVVNGTYYLIKYYGKYFCGQEQVISSEKFLSNVQTRAIFLYKTNKIGYVAMICIGMVEVSSCIIHRNLINKMVKKGQEVGYFQFGGSSIALLFEKNYANKLKFNITKQKDYDIKTESLIKVRSSLADF